MDITSRIMVSCKIKTRDHHIIHERTIVRVNDLSKTSCIFSVITNYTVQWKILAGENFGEFGDLLQIRQSFIRQLLVISEKAIGLGLIRQSFLRQMQFSQLFAKVFSCQIFPLYGSMKCQTYSLHPIIKQPTSTKINCSGGLVF